MARGKKKEADQAREPLLRKGGVLPYPLVLLLLAGFVMRLLHGVSTWQADPLVKSLTADARYYDQWSQAIAKGRLVTEAPFYLPPLYPHLLALERLLLGSTLPWTIVFQGFLGLLSLCIVYRITRDHFGEASAVFAGLISLFYAPFLFFETRLLATTLAVALGLASVALLERAIRRASFSSMALAGLVLGLLCLARPNFLLFAGPALVLVLIITFKEKKRGWMPFAGAALGLLIPLATSLTHNVATSGEWVLLTGNGGINFYFGNHAKATGVNDAPSRDFSSIFDQKAAARRLAESETGRPMRDGEVSRFWRQKALGEISSDTGAWIRLMARKMKLFLSSFEYGVIYIPEVEAHLSWVQPIQVVPAGLILALGGSGLWLAFRRKKKGLWPILLFLGSNLATVLLFFMAGRFRLPFMAGLLPFAGFFLAHTVEELRSRRFSTPVFSLALCAALTIISFQLVDERTKNNQCRRARITLSKAFEKEGDLNRARQAAEEALRSGITPAVLYQLGRVEESGGNISQAKVHYHEASRLDPIFLEPLGSLAELFEKEKDWERAMEMRKRVIGIVPYRFEAYYNLGLTCLEADRVKEGVEHLEKAVSLAPESALAWKMLGQAARRAGNPARAIEALRKVLEIDPSQQETLADDLKELEKESPLQLNKPEDES